MDTLIDTFKTCLLDLVIISKEIIIGFNKLFNLVTDLLYIKHSANIIFKNLDLKLIPVIFCIKSRGCFFSNAPEPLLGFNLNFIVEDGEWKDIFDNINYAFNSRRDKLFFIVAHEISHYLQWKKHFKWYFKNVEIHRQSISYLGVEMTPAKYRKIKLESFADKLAIGIIKRLNKKEE